ncbi:hypothetical protein FEF26_09250 [Nesterenkonia salmonea]|uniref:Uncharacterized protein n=1 Tax=Nesterenkonia salmonea TaxID=1804987 RepID=A0A5R9BA34_9MICC|nr:hypothetical protein [Nesterenkonia salmonea]TLP96376.1 hypothetical protein FEF26_09250 [Nesterenkonia salmonea]
MILGIVAIVEHRGEGEGIAGVVTGAIGTIITIVGVLLATGVFSAAEEDVERLDEGVASVDPDGEWEATIPGVTPDADDEIADENPYNDPAAEGMGYMMMDLGATYLGDDSDSPMTGVKLAYVTNTGETIASYDYSAVTPDAFESSE